MQRNTCACSGADAAGGGVWLPFPCLQVGVMLRAAKITAAIGAAVAGIALVRYYSARAVPAAARALSASATRGVASPPNDPLNRRIHVTPLDATTSSALLQSIKQRTDTAAVISSILTLDRLALEPWQAFTRAVVVTSTLPLDGTPARFDCVTCDRICEYVQQGGHVIVTGSVVFMHAFVRCRGCRLPCRPGHSTHQGCVSCNWRL